MKNEFLLFCIVFVPVLGSFILPLAGNFSQKIRNILALVFVLVSLIFSAILLPKVASGEIITINYPLLLGMSFILHADMLAVFMAIASSLIGAVIVLYSFGYISHYKNQNEYYLMVVLFLGSMMGLVFSGNLIFLFLFWEITTIACWRLIGFFRERIHVLRADKAFLITVFGALIMLIGFVMLYNETGSFDLLVIKDVLKGNPVSNIAVMLILFGILSKSATLPFHTWLPDAGVAPSPVTALLHAAVLVKIGVYVFARLFIATFTLDVMWHTVVPVIAGLSMLISAGAAFIETDLKRIIAYSTISQIGFIFLGLSTGNEIGIAGGLLYILMHGLAKGGLFLCAGIVEQNTGTKDITKLGGLMKVMPITAVSFLFCAFSVMGIPPFGGFFSKYMVITGAVVNNQLAIALTFFAGAILTILYLLRVFMTVFLGDLKTDLVKEKSATMVFSVAFLAFLSLAGGIFIKYPADFVALTVQQMLGIIK
ncbi:MAG: NADH-quinone oxidoreductase subunit L [Elusimicrobia bacterium]|nr:NADH-quinone oxidoreductase subunit L [Elusimicrobiota bacterium]